MEVIELNGKSYRRSERKKETCNGCAFYDYPTLCSDVTCDGRVFVELTEEELPKKKVYISGKITGLSYDKAKALFFDAEDKLNATGKYVAVNPMRGESQGNTWEEYMKKDIKMLMECDMIFFLPNWTTSKGSNLECLIARELGIQTLIM